MDTPTAAIPHDNPTRESEWQSRSNMTFLVGDGSAADVFDSVIDRIRDHVRRDAALVVVAFGAMGSSTRLNPIQNPVRGGLAPGVQRKVRSAIACALERNWRLSDLADLAGLSDSHFARAFKQSVGMSPHRYILTRRIAAAADLVKSTNRPLCDIALEVGFFDHSHFTRSFARMMGQTPRDFRKTQR